VNYRSTNIRFFELLFKNPVENLCKEVEQRWGSTQSERQKPFRGKYVLPLESEEWSVYWRYGYVAKSGLEVALNYNPVSPKSLDRLNCMFNPAILDSVIMLGDFCINPAHISWWVR